MAIALSVVGVVVLLAIWIGWIATRVDRLNSRTTAARASLDAQLVRRAAAAQAIVDRSCAAMPAVLSDRLRIAARASLNSDDVTREAAENDLSKVLRELPDGLDPDLVRDIQDAASRVVMARRFYNDAVRDTWSLRRRPLPRLLRLGQRDRLPVFFEIDDNVKN